MVPAPAQVESQFGESLYQRTPGKIFHRVDHGSKTPRGSGGRLAGCSKGTIDDLLGVVLNSQQVVFSSKALAVEFVDFLGARRSSGEPSGLSDDLHPSDWFVVSRRSGE